MEWQFAKEKKKTEVNLCLLYFVIFMTFIYMKITSSQSLQLSECQKENLKAHADIKWSRLRFEVQAHMGNAVHSCSSQGINTSETHKYNIKNRKAGSDTSEKTTEIEIFIKTTFNQLLRLNITSYIPVCVQRKNIKSQATRHNYQLYQ